MLVHGLNPINDKTLSFFLNIINGNERISSSRSLISHGNLSRCDVIISYHNQTSIQVGGGDEECGNNVPFPHNVRILSILIHRWIWRSVMCHSLNNYRDAPLHFKMKRKTRLCLFTCLRCLRFVIVHPIVG